MLPSTEMDNDIHTKITSFQAGEDQQPTKPQPFNQQSVNSSQPWCITSQAAEVLTEAFDADNSLLQQSSKAAGTALEALTCLSTSSLVLQLNHKRGEWTVTNPCVKGLGSQAGIYWCSISIPQPGTQQDEEEGQERIYRSKHREELHLLQLSREKTALQTAFKNVLWESAVILDRFLWGGCLTQNIRIKI